MANQPSVEEVWNDPDFQGLPAEEKRKVLTQIDNDFAQLPTAEQDKVVGIDAVSTDESPTSSTTNVFGAVGDALKAQIPQVKEVGTLGLSSAPQITQRVSNFAQNKPNDPAQTLLQMAANRPDVTAQVGASMIPGVGLGPSLARIGGSAAAGALSQENKTGNAVMAGGLQTVLEALPYGAGRVAPAIRGLMAKASKTDANAIKQLADNPSLLFTGPNKAEAQALYNEAAVKAGLDPNVSDQVLFGAKRKFVKDVLLALKAKKDLSNQTLLDARQITDDLIETAKRTGKKNIVKGFAQRRELLQQRLSQQAPEIRSADKVWSQYKTRDQFMSPVPLAKDGTPEIARTAAMGLVGGLPALAMSPYLQGVAASAVGAVNKVPRQAVGVTLQTIRQYLQGQQSQPGR